MRIVLVITFLKENKNEKLFDFRINVDIWIGLKNETYMQDGFLLRVTLFPGMQERTRTSDKEQKNVT